MKLSLEQLKKITCGLVNIEEKDGFFRLNRFTNEQINLYTVNIESILAVISNFLLQNTHNLLNRAALRLPLGKSVILPLWRSDTCGPSAPP